MNTKMNSDFIEDEFLRNFLNENDLKNFTNKIKNLEEQTALVKPELTGKEKKQIKFKFEDDSLTSFQIDLLITFAEDKLPTAKFLEFLKQLVNDKIKAGKYAAASINIEKIIATCEKHNNFTNFLAEAYYLMGEIYSRQALWRLSFESIKRAKEIYSSIKDNIGLAKCENLIGTIYGDKGELVNAVAHFESALSYLQELDNSELRGSIQLNLGIIHNIQNEYDLAILAYRRGLIDFKDSTNQKRVAEIYHNLGLLYIKKKDWELAIKQFDTAINLSIQLRYSALLGMSYLQKAFIYTQTNDIKTAEAFADKALSICTKVDDKLSVADIYKVKGIIRRNLKDYKVAEDFLITSSKLNEQLGNKLNEAETKVELGILYKQMKRQNESKACFTEALNYFETIKAADEIKTIENYLS